jgi:hypothetical protein
MNNKLNKIISVFCLCISCYLPVCAKFVATNKVEAIGNVELQLNDADQIVSLETNGGRPIISMNINNVPELLTGRNNYMNIEVFKVIDGALNFVGSFTYTLNSKKPSKVITIPLPEFINQSETYQFHVYDTNGNLNSKFSYSFSADDLVKDVTNIIGLTRQGMDPNVTDDLVQTVLRNITVRSIGSAKIPSIEKYGESFVMNIPDGLRASGATKTNVASVLKVNAFGKMNERTKYDNAKQGFVYLDNDTKQAYIKGKGVGLWSNPIPFTNTPGSGSGSGPIDFEAINDEIIPITKVKGGEELTLEVEDITKDIKVFNEDLLFAENKIKQIDTQVISITSKANEAVTKSQEALSKIQDATTKAIDASNKAIDANNKATDALNKIQDATTKATDASNKAIDASNKATDASNKAIDANNKATDASNKAIDANNKATDASNKATNASNLATTASNKADLVSSQVSSITSILPTKLNSDFSNLSGDLNISGKIKTANTADKTINLNLERSIRESGTLFGKVASNSIPVIRFASPGSSATWTVSLPKDLVKDLTNNNKFKFKLLWSPNNNLGEKVNWELQYFSYNVGDVVSSSQNFSQNKLVSAPAQDLGLASTEFEIPTKDFKDMMVIKLSRKDSNNIQPNLMGFEINYPALSLEKL